MDFSYLRAAALLIAAFLDLILLLILWFKSKDRVVFHFSWAVLFSIFYCFTYAARFMFDYNRLFWARANWIGILIMPAFIAFAYSFSGKTKHFKIKIAFWYLIAVTIVILSITTSYFVKAIDPEYPYVDMPGPLEPIGRMYFISALFVGWFYLLKEYFRSKGIKRLQLKYFILGIGIHSLGGLLAAGIIPLIYPEFNYVDISAILTVPGVALVTYGFIKRELFEIKVVLTEILVVIIALFLLAQGLLSINFADKIFSLVIFVFFLLVGYLLIRVTQEEVRRKIQAERLAQELKDLNKTLEERVDQRTIELKKSYDEIKKRTEELEKFYNLTVGRELKILELRKQLRDSKK